jgi:hypothetical protein
VLVGGQVTNTIGMKNTQIIVFGLHPVQPD